MESIRQQNSIVLIYLSPPRQSRSDMESDITELWNLVQSLGDSQITHIIRQAGPEHSATYIGPGKIQEIVKYITDNPAHTILFNGHMKPGQKFAILQSIWNTHPAIQVWDRIDLILAIFSKHAFTSEAKLQIKLAQMHAMGPRIYGMGFVLSRQGGGIGTRGIGETNTELMRRHWDREIKRTNDALSKTVSTRESQIHHRKHMGLQTISIVGYTNAGKTSLFNLLTHKKHLVENALFATLDSSVGEVYIPSVQSKILISDTIGFIANLPPSLINAFKSTLMESIFADAILHVVDISDPLVRDKVNVVHAILDELGISREKEILVFNKIDTTPSLDKQFFIDKARETPYVFISTKTGEGIDTLRNTILPQKIHPRA